MINGPGEEIQADETSLDKLRGGDDPEPVEEGEGHTRACA